MRKRQIHPVKSDRYISFMVTTNTARAGRSFHIPKIMFLFLAMLLIGVGFFAGSVYTNTNNRINALQQDIEAVLVEKQLAEEEKASVEAVLSEKELVISDLTKANAEKDSQLNTLELQTKEILGKIESLEAIRDSIYEKLNEAPEELYTSNAATPGSTETTTDVTAEGDASITPNDVDTTSSSLSSANSSVSKTSVVDEFNRQYSEILSLLASLEAKLDENYEAMNTLSEMTDAYVPYIESIPSGWPIKDSKITCPFGYRTNPITGKGKEFHYGVDFSARYRQDLYATAPGTVIFSGYVSGYGYNIVIDHGYGYSTRYAHCSKLLFKKGDVVAKGDRIALAGSTGRSTAVHLHYEVILNGERVDPADYLD